MPGRPVTARVLVALIVLASLPVAAGAQEELQERFSHTQQELRDARAQLDSIHVRSEAAQQQLQVVDAQLVDLTGRLRTLESDLATKQQTYSEARERTAEATVRLVEVSEELERIRLALETRERNFEDRVAATYKYGTVSFVEAMLGTESVTDFVNTGYYVRSVLRYDTEVIVDIERLNGELIDRRAEVDALRERLQRDEQAAKRVRDEVEQLTQTQRRLTDQVADERSRHAALIQQLEADEASYSQLVAELEATSRSLADELRNSVWRAGAPGSGELVWPTDGRKTSDFGWRTHPIFGSRRMHAGIDISGSTGQAVVSAAEGLVVHADWRGGYGLAVVIDHGGGVATLYGHLSSISVAAGEVVGQSQTVGAVGSTGWSTGPHLHFEVRVNGEPRDPMAWYS
ncbi:MAG: peptidoglycan DD-metalloendopeptidase family protein [Actinobacteria bacterium]|nr:peptidoglycan DD-metalloendopeptidase family protein [Actinomycetota bacterium]